MAVRGGSEKRRLGGACCKTTVVVVVGVRGTKAREKGFKEGVTQPWAWTTPFAASAWA